jgi:hypothetical protein
LNGDFGIPSVVGAAVDVKPPQLRDEGMETINKTVGCGRGLTDAERGKVGAGEGERGNEVLLHRVRRGKVETSETRRVAEEVRETFDGDWGGFDRVSVVVGSYVEDVLLREGGFFEDWGGNDEVRGRLSWGDEEIGSAVAADLDAPQGGEAASGERGGGKR